MDLRRVWCRATKVLRKQNQGTAILLLFVLGGRHTFEIVRAQLVARVETRLHQIVGPLFQQRPKTRRNEIGRLDSQVRYLKTVRGANANLREVRAKARAERETDR